MPKKKKSRKKTPKKRVKKRSKNKTLKKRKTKFKKRASKKRNKKLEENHELVIKTKPEWIKTSLANKAQYQNKYNDSIKNNNAFWKKEGKRITWIKPYKKIKDVKYSSKEVRIKWFEDGTLNAFC